MVFKLPVNHDDYIRERERERDRDRERQRQRETETERQRETETDRQTETETERQRQTDRQISVVGEAMDVQAAVLVCSGKSVYRTLCC